MLSQVLRRFLLIGVAVLLSPGTLTQLMLGAIVALIYLMVQMQACPFRHTSDAFVALTCSLSLVTVFLCCIVLRVSTLAELDQASPVLRAAFRMPSTLLSFALLLPTLVLGYQLHNECVQATARRLRWLKDGSKVRLDSLPAGHYHLYLSQYAPTRAPRTCPHAIDLMPLTCVCCCTRNWSQLLGHGAGPDACREAAPP